MRHGAMRMLVVYYSRTGTTKKVAESISGVLKCDMEEIFDTKKRTGLLGFLRSGMEATFNMTTTLKEIKNDPAQYDIVIVGTPIWSHKISSPIRTYLSRNKNNLKNVALFCTYGSAISDKIIDTVEAMCGKRPLDFLKVTMDEVIEGTYHEKARAFAYGLLRT
jgi:flavodoxin